jgi:hypothetical protein
VSTALYLTCVCFSGTDFSESPLNLAASIDVASGVVSAGLFTSSSGQLDCNVDPSKGTV